MTHSQTSFGQKARAFLAQSLPHFLRLLLSLLPLGALRGALPEFCRVYEGFEHHAISHESLYPAASFPVNVEHPVANDPGRSQFKRIPQLAEQFPEIRLYQMRSATVFFNRRFSSVIVRGSCLISRRTEPGPWDFGVSARPESPGAVVSDSRGILGFLGGFTSTKTSTALFIGTRAPDNYYHWVANALPSLFAANLSPRLADSVPVLVPASIQKHRQLVEALEMVAGGRKVQYFSDHDAIKVDSLYVVDPPPLYDTPLSKSLNTRLPLRANITALLDFRNSILSAVAHNEAHQFGDRIFLLRPDGDPRGANQQQLLKVAESMGFVGVRPDNLSFRSQVSLFANIKYVTGASGAGFVNLCFAAKPEALIYRSQCNERENFFAVAAGLTGGRVHCLQGEKRGAKSTFFVSPEIFRDKLSKILEKPGLDN